jgi:hypothetical protein
MLDRPLADTCFTPCIAFLHHQVEFQQIMITQRIPVFITRCYSLNLSSSQFERCGTLDFQASFALNAVELWLSSPRVTKSKSYIQVSIVLSTSQGKLTVLPPHKTYCIDSQGISDSSTLRISVVKNRIISTKLLILMAVIKSCIRYVWGQGEISSLTLVDGVYPRNDASTRSTVCMAIAEDVLRQLPIVSRVYQGRKNHMVTDK